MLDKITIKQRMLWLLILLLIFTYGVTYKMLYNHQRVVTVCSKSEDEKLADLQFKEKGSCPSGYSELAINMFVGYKLPYSWSNRLSVLSELTENFLFVYSSLLLFLASGVFYVALRPLWRLKKEVGDVDSKHNRLNAYRYASDLMPLAEKLNKFHDSMNNAELRADRTEEKADEAEKKCLEVIDTRMSIATLARDTGGLMKHNVTNIKNMMPKPLQDLPEELQRFVNQLLTATDKVVEQTEEFIQGVNSIIHKDPANIHEILDKRIKRQRDNSPEIHLEAEGMDTVRDIQVGINSYNLEKICTELLLNAEKYCGPAMKIHVRAIKHDSYVFVEFHNDVETFPERNLDDLFKFGIRGQHKNISGSGHGLYFIKQLAIASACELKAERSKTLRGGICFSLKVPIHHPDPAVG